MFQNLEQKLLELGGNMSVEWFTMIGAFVEEIIAPIPSPLIMMTAGLMAYEQSYTVFMVVLVAILGAVSKTLASSVLYYVTDKVEDVLVEKFGRFFGVEKGMIEEVGDKLNKGVLDYFTVFALRAIPIVPSAPISILCGLFKVNFKAYVIGTFFGTIIRNGIYLYIGYSGLELIDKFNSDFSSAENYVQLFIVVLVMFLIIGWKLKRK